MKPLTYITQSALSDADMTNGRVRNRNIVRLGMYVVPSIRSLIQEGAGIAISLAHGEECSCIPTDARIRITLPRVLATVGDSHLTGSFAQHIENAFKSLECVGNERGDLRSTSKQESGPSTKYPPPAWNPNRTPNSAFRFWLEAHPSEKELLEELELDDHLIGFADEEQQFEHHREVIQGALIEFPNFLSDLQFSWCVRHLVAQLGCVGHAGSLLLDLHAAQQASSPRELEDLACELNEFLQNDFGFLERLARVKDLVKLFTLIDHPACSYRALITNLQIYQDPARTAGYDRDTARRARESLARMLIPPLGMDQERWLTNTTPYFKPLRSCPSGDVGLWHIPVHGLVSLKIHDHCKTWCEHGRAFAFRGYRQETSELPRDGHHTQNPNWTGPRSKLLLAQTLPSENWLPPAADYGPFSSFAMATAEVQRATDATNKKAIESFESITALLSSLLSKSATSRNWTEDSLTRQLRAIVPIRFENDVRSTVKWLFRISAPDCTEEDHDVMSVRRWGLIVDRIYVARAQWQNALTVLYSQVLNTWPGKPKWATWKKITLKQVFGSPPPELLGVTANEADEYFDSVIQSLKSGSWNDVGGAI